MINRSDLFIIVWDINKQKVRISCVLINPVFTKDVHVQTDLDLEIARIGLLSSLYFIRIFLLRKISFFAELQNFAEY